LPHELGKLAETDVTTSGAEDAGRWRIGPVSFTVIEGAAGLRNTFVSGA
jgi:hypothetical protein